MKQSISSAIATSLLVKSTNAFNWNFGLCEFGLPDSVDKHAFSMDQFQG